MLHLVWTFKGDPKRQATRKSLLKLSKHGKVVTDVSATVRQNLNRSDFERQPKAAQELLIPFGSTVQHVFVHEDFAAREVDFLDTETGGGFEMWPQFDASDLL